MALSDHIDTTRPLVTGSIVVPILGAVSLSSPIEWGVVAVLVVGVPLLWLVTWKKIRSNIRRYGSWHPDNDLPL